LIIIIAYILKGLQSVNSYS